MPKTQYPSPQTPSERELPPPPPPPAPQPARMLRHQPPDGIACQPGRQIIHPHPELCEVCAAGRTDTDSNFSTPCEPCLAGRYAPPGTIGSSCAMCPEGRHDGDMDPGTQCEECSRGTYQRQPGQTSCQDCEPGQVQSHIAQSNGCEDCMAGQYQALSAQPRCQTCPPGKFSAERRQLSCSNCAVGRFQNSRGRSDCIDCANGTVATAEAQSLCTDCAAGYYQPQPMQTSCQFCDAGQFQSAVGSDSCQECPTGQIENSDRSGCRGYTYTDSCSEQDFGLFTRRLNQACCDDAHQDCSVSPPDVCSIGCAVAVFLIRDRCAPRIQDDAEAFRNAIDALWASCLRVSADDAAVAANCESGSLQRPAEEGVDGRDDTEPIIQLISAASECPVGEGCTSNPCRHTNRGTTCDPDLASDAYTCNCGSGFAGTNCEDDIDDACAAVVPSSQDCEVLPGNTASPNCLCGACCESPRGRCRDTEILGRHTCTCHPGFEGKGLLSRCAHY
eukprot:SAG31_NODE_301_length_18103_cov_13.772551_14_plen_502_part_00